MTAGHTAAVVVVVLLLGACDDGAPAAPPTPTTHAEAVGPLEPSEPFGLTAVTVRSPDSEVAVSIPVYDAYRPKARRRGLMHRTHLPKRTGMVFRFPADSQGGFWMKNTLIPLSIAFFDAEGVVVATADMQPCDADPCPSYDPGTSYRGALEVNQGFLDRLGVEPGWRVEVPFGVPPAR